MKKIADDSVYVINKALDGLPDDFKISTHICRGNFKSTYLFEVVIAPVADYLGDLHYDTYFLEYDDARSGDFTPLTAIWANRPDDASVGPGLVSHQNWKQRRILRREFRTRAICTAGKFGFISAMWVCLNRRR